LKINIGSFRRRARHKSRKRLLNTAGKIGAPNHLGSDASTTHILRRCSPEGRINISIAIIRP